MTEAGWLTCTDPRKMLERFRDDRRYDRKLRLFTAACCRRVWHLLDRWGHDAVGVAERLSDAQPTQEDVGFWDGGREVVSGACRSGGTPWAYAVQAAGCAVGTGKRWRSAQEAVRLAHAALAAASSAEMDVLPPSGRRARDRSRRESWVAVLRCVFGNPFRPVWPDPAWLTAAAVTLAHAAYDERELPGGTLDPDRLAVLADALEEAGCADPDLLGHLRGPGPHVRGCWPVDLILAKDR